MSTQCDQVELFADGELPPQEAEAFRAHLPDCPRCHVQLSNLLLLERLGSRYVAKLPEKPAHGQPPPSRAVVSPRPARWHLVSLGAAVCAIAVVLGLTVLSPRGLPPEPSEVAWNPGGRTSSSPRVSDPRADRYQPAASQLMGEGTPRRKLPLEELALLEKRGDFRGMAAVYLAWHRPQEALDLLDSQDLRSPDIQSDRAAALIALGRHEEALHQLEQLLSAHPEHRQARWNRALAREALGMLLLAARDYQEVARSQEDGWAAEAGKRAEQLLSTAHELGARWTDALTTGKALVAQGLPSGNVPEARSPILRLYFYEAVRTRTSREEVLALLPLAKQLDADVGGAVLQRYVEHVSQRDFSVRAPLAREYARILAGEYAQTIPAFGSDPQASTLLARLLRSGEDDLALGALVNARAVQTHLEDFEARARASQDPWFEVLAAQRRADALINRGDFRNAQAVLEGARRLCESTRIVYRCIDLELDLAHLHAQLLDADKVKEHAQNGWQLSRAWGLRGKELQFLELLSTAARLRNDVPVARAYLYESLEHVRGDARQEQYIHQNLAHLELHALDFERARAELDQALATGLPLTLYGAAALADISRQRPGGGDAEALARALASAGSLEKGTHALALHYQGRFLLEKERVKGQGLLRDAIREAEAAGSRDENALHARTYSYTSLILDEAKAHDFNAALRLFGEELGFDVPGRCVLALTADSERSLLVVRGADGGTRGYYEGARTQQLPLELSGFVPREALASLESCEEVQVLARPPLQGRSGLLPPSLAWSYRTRREAPRALVGNPVHLVVKNVQYDAERGLAPLTWNTPSGPDEAPSRILQGAQATPSQVLQEMEGATDIDLVTHGILSPVSDASYLVLAKEQGTGGTDELRVQRLRQAKLKGAPLVVLAACHGGRAAPVLHEPVSLPNALLEAGARAVLAATKPIPDLEASEFFNAVRARIRQGASPAVALRDERTAWLQQGRGAAWLNSILLFE